jgi:uncharacterized protein YxeA
MKKTLGYIISLAVLLFGAIGNFHLYKEIGNWNESIRNIVITIAAIGVELAVLLLIHSIADNKIKGINKTITGWLLVIIMPVSLMGQYAYLLKEAAQKTEKVAIASTNIDTIATDRDNLNAEKTILLAALNKEQSSGYGPKAQTLSAQLSAINNRLESLSTKTEANQSASLEVTELSVLAKELGYNEKDFTKVIILVFLLIANAIGFWLVYLSNLHSDTNTVKAAAKPAKRPKKTSKKEDTKGLPNVIPFSSYSSTRVNSLSAN